MAINHAALQAALPNLRKALADVEEYSGTATQAFVKLDGTKKRPHAETVTDSETEMALAVVDVESAYAVFITAAKP